MSIFWILLGLIPPGVCGWYLLRVLEWRTPVLRPLERGAMAVVLGGTASMFVSFLLQVTLKVPFSLWGFLGAFAVLLVPLVLLRMRLPKTNTPVGDALPPSPPLGAAAKVVLAVLGAWTVVKISAMALVLLQTPTYFDDSFDNWNLRGTVFYHTQSLQLTLPPDTAPGGISSYPPTVPMLKAWVSSLRGGWDEGTVNGLHLTWLIASLVLVYAMIRRRASRAWAFAGVYVLASLPLFLMHGANAYADVFVASHVLTAVFLLFLSSTARDEDEAMTALRLAGAAVAMLVFTKNEALALYVPMLLCTGAVTLWLLWKRGVLSTGQATQTMGVTAFALLCVAGPWVFFKWMHGLPFGNAHSVGEFTFGWQPGTLLAILVNIAFEGNWLLLFPLLFILIPARWRDAFRAPEIVPVLFFLATFAFQTSLYLFTSLSIEARMQTAYARGVIHLVPVAVVIFILLTRKFIGSEEKEVVKGL